MQRSGLGVLVIALAVATPAMGWAQSYPSVEAEVGIADFNRDLSSALRPGPAWGVRARMPLTPSLNLVVGYGGAATRASDPAFAGTALVTSNSGYAALELGFPTGASLRPYLFTGLGVMRVSVPSKAVGPLRPDTAGVVPTGLGLEFELTERLSVGGRVTYNFTFDNELVPGLRHLTADLWSGALTFAVGLP